MGKGRNLNILILLGTVLLLLALITAKYTFNAVSYARQQSAEKDIGKAATPPTAAELEQQALAKAEAAKELEEQQAEFDSSDEDESASDEEPVDNQQESAAEAEQQSGSGDSELESLLAKKITGAKQEAVLGSYTQRGADITAAKKARNPLAYIHPVTITTHSQPADFFFKNGDILRVQPESRIEMHRQDGLLTHLVLLRGKVLLVWKKNKAYLRTRAGKLRNIRGISSVSWGKKLRVTQKSGSSRLFHKTGKYLISQGQVLRASRKSEPEINALTSSD